MSGLQEASEKMQEASTAPAVSMWSLRQGLRVFRGWPILPLCLSRSRGFGTAVAPPFYFRMLRVS